MRRLALLSLALTACDRGASASPTSPRMLGPALTAETAPLLGSATLDLVRADPHRYRLRMLTSKVDAASQPAPGWREQFQLIAVTNAGMFHPDGTPVGLLVEDDTDLSADHPTLGGYLAFDPRSPTDAAIVITGRDCPGFDLAALRTRYRSLLQADRLLGCAGEPLPWKDTKRYSAAAFGVDRAGRAVFIHARAAVTMTELARAVSDLDLSGALFLDGGPVASLVVRGDAGELSRVGSFETGFAENDENQAFYWIPNVLALQAK